MKLIISTDSRDTLVVGVEAACVCEYLPLRSYQFLQRGGTFADFIQSSAGQQLKILEINEAGNLHMEKMGRGYAWLDTGTHRSLLEAGLFVSTMEHRQGLKMACPEKIAWRNGWIDDVQLRSLATPLAKSEYGIYLSTLLEEGRSET